MCIVHTHMCACICAQPCIHIHIEEERRERERKRERERVWACFYGALHTREEIHPKQAETVRTARGDAVADATVQREGMLLYTQTHIIYTERGDVTIHTKIQDLHTHTRLSRDLPAAPLIISKTLSRAMSPMFLLSILRHVCQCKREGREEGVSRHRDAYMTRVEENTYFHAKWT
jgi:hypothetical protein